MSASRRLRRVLWAALAALAAACGGGGGGGDPSAPVVTGVSPTSGSSSAAVAVTITGESFLVKAAGVVLPQAWLDDTPLQSIVWVNAETLTAVVPAGLPAGPKRLTVENGFGKRGSLAGAYTVQAPAALAAALAVEGSPAAVHVGDALTVDLAVTNTGEAPAHVTAVTPGFDPKALSCDAVSPGGAVALEGGASTVFTWTCTPRVAGVAALGASVAGTEDVTQVALEATAAALGLDVLPPTSLVAVISATPSVVNVGRSVAVTLTVTNGGAAVTLTSIAPAVAAGSTAAAACGSASPSPGPLASGRFATFSWSCDTSAVGALLLTATVRATETASGASLVVSPQAPFDVTVQTGASLTAAITAGATVAGTGDAVGYTLRVTNGGEAEASVAAVAATPSTGLACGAASPASASIAGGAYRDFTFSCSAAAGGAYTVGARVTASDASDGADVSVTARAVDLTVLPPLTGTLSLSRSTADVDQPVTVTLTLRNDGALAAAVSGITASPGARCDTSATPTGLTLPAGQSGSVGWICRGAGAGSLPLGASAAAVGQGTSVDVSPVVAPVTLTVQDPPALAGTLSVSPSSVAVGGQVTVTLPLANGTTASATATGIAVVPSGDALASCDAGTVENVPATLAGGATAEITWTCSGVDAGTASLGATVSATDANTTTGVTGAVTGTTLEVTPSP